MFLTHMILLYQEYLEVAKECKGFKILDNSVIELGSAMDPSLVIEAAKEIGADEVVLPDVFMNSPGTIRMIETTIGRFIRELPDTQLMAVVHGKDVGEWMDCLKYIQGINEIDTIGIPKCTAKMHPEGRDYFIRTALTTDTTKNIHLLGLQYSFHELDQWPEYFFNSVRSMDTIMGEWIDLTTNEIRPDGWTINLESGGIFRK